MVGPATVAVLGRMALVPQFQGQGSSRVNPTKVDIPLDELRQAAPEVSFTYAQGYREDGAADAELLHAAVQAARAAETAILFVGLPEGVEAEGYDRPDMELPAGHVELIRAVVQVQPRTVVVLHNGAPVSLAGWADQVPAVLLAGLAGQASGGAVADLLFGKVSPSGKLAETYPVRLEDTPAYLNYPGENGRVVYGEGLFIGYRYYDTKGIDPLFPFGHGLSYTTFAYGPLSLSRAQMRPEDTLEISLPITNTGQRPGAEVVQLYVRPRQSRLARPVKELKGFAKVELAPGETKPVSFTLDVRDLSYYDPAKGGWVAEPGAYDLLVGASSRDIRAQAIIQLVEGVRAEEILTEESSIKAWVEHPAGRAALERFLPAEVAARLLHEPLHVFVLELPLKKLPMMSQGAVDAATVARIVEAVRG